MGILAHDGPFREDAKAYSTFVGMACEEDDIHYQETRVASEAYEAVEAAIQDANNDENVHGILVYYPIFKGRALRDADRSSGISTERNQNNTVDSSNHNNNRRGPYKNRLTGVYYKTPDDYLRDVVSPIKDVEGLCHDFNARWLFRAGKRKAFPNPGAMPPSSSSSPLLASPSVMTAQQANSNENGHVGTNGGLRRDGVVYPCTALSVLRIIESQVDRLDGRTITVVNRSELLGRPLAAMLANLGAHVFSVDADSILTFGPGGRLRRVSDSTMNTRRCIEQSSIVVSGVPSPSFRLPSEVINPGSVVVNVSEYENVLEDEVLDIPGVRFVPQVGKVTVAALEENLTKLHSRQMQHQRQEEKQQTETNIRTQGRESSAV